MIRKMLVAGAAAILPVTGLAGAALVASSGVAGAASPVVATGTCSVGGAITFAGGGITAGGNITTDKTNTTSVTLTSADGGNCAASTTFNITQKNTKCKVTGLASSVVVSGITLTPDGTTLPGCAAAPKSSQFGSALGFVGGITVGGVPTSTTDGIAKALKKGVAYVDNGVSLLLIPNQTPGAGVVAVLPGGVCGSAAGFQSTGTIKKTTHTFTLTLCLSGDSGTGTTGSFLVDLASEVFATSVEFGPNWSLSTAIATGTIDSSTSTLVIS